MVLTKVTPSDLRATILRPASRDLSGEAVRQHHPTHSQRRAPKNTPTTNHALTTRLPSNPRPSSTSGRLDHPWLLRDWARTFSNDLSSRSKHLEASRHIFSSQCKQNRHPSHHRDDANLFFSKDIQPTASALQRSKASQRPKAVAGRPAAPVPKMVELSGINR